ncbi:MAG: hypothetical protein LUO93_12260 [Methanomicrobiales archaeon]|nr:hypothetical protein [Methanomicrobiales archaeon]
MTLPTQTGEGNIVNKKMILGLMALLVIALTVYPVSAARPPTSPGQPNQDCEALFELGSLVPGGFNTDGFEHATTVYAGSGHSLISNNPKAVSQYDVACFQQYQRLFL